MLDGQWTITQDLYDYVCKNYPASSYPNLLEFGSGQSTLAWAKAGYDITSIEHDKKYLTKYSVHAPINKKDNYYNRDILLKLVKSKEWDIWVIDGPPGTLNSRHNFLDVFKIVQPRIVVIDDLHRAAYLKWAAKVPGPFKDIHHSKAPRHIARVINYEQR